jgi:hypothetical protein
MELTTEIPSGPAANPVHQLMLILLELGVLRTPKCPHHRIDRLSSLGLGLLWRVAKETLCGLEMTIRRCPRLCN